MTRSESQPETVTCPACGAELRAEDVKAPIVECPDCHEQFFAVSGAETGAEASPESAPADVPDAEAELSANRIRQIAALRRGAYRSRSYCIVAIFGALVAAIKLTTRSLADFRQHHVSAAMAYLLGVVAAAAVAEHFFRTARRLTREVNEPALRDPEEPPDFSTLNDGTQHARQLEAMHELEAAGQKGVEGDEKPAG